MSFSLTPQIKKSQYIGPWIPFGPCAAETGPWAAIKIPVLLPTRLWTENLRGSKDHKAFSHWHWPHISSR